MRVHLNRNDLRYPARMTPDDSPTEEPCPECGASLAPLPFLHVKRRCECGRVKHVADRGADGRGLMVNAGDEVVLPAGWLKMSLDFRKSTGQFFRFGMTWFVQQLLFNGSPSSKEEIGNMLAVYTDEADETIRDSELLQGLDPDRREDADEAFALLKDRQHTKEWWAMCVGALSQLAAAAIQDNDAATAAWRMNQLTNAHAMLVYTRDVEPLAWRGYRLSELQKVLDIWQQNQENGNEEFWQEVFRKHSFVLSQIFALPVVIMHEKAYVGGKGITNTGGGLVDFLVQNKLTQNVGLIEIKTPTTRLLGSKYRDGCFSMSSHLSGAVVQVSQYKDSLLKAHSHLSRGEEQPFDAFEPECVVISGNYAAEMTDSERRSSFELFRANLRYVRVVTFDELFQKVATLLALLGEVEPLPAVK